MLRHETGTYALRGDQLTITPKYASQTEIDEKKGTKQIKKRTFETATYKLQKVYMDGLQKWYLALSIAKETARDGAYSQNSAYPSSYLLEADPIIEWKYPADR